MVPAHFHDVDGDISVHNVGKIFVLFKILMLPAHFHNVTYTIIFGKKYCRSSQRAQQEIQYSTLKSKSYEQCRTKHAYYNNKAAHF